MNHFILFPFIGIFLLPTRIDAQQLKEDSLRTILATEVQDTTRLKTLNALSWLLFQTGNLEESQKRAEEAILLADSTQHPKPNWAKQRKAMAYSIIGIINCNQGDYTEALVNQMESLRLGKETGNTNGVADSYTNLGIIYWYQGKYPEAFEQYFAALKIYEASGDKGGIGNIHNNIGGIHEYLKEYDEALKHYLIALDMRKSIADQYGIAGAYNNIGNIYDYQEKYTESLDNHFKALQLCEELGYKKGIAETNDNIANTYSNMKEYEEEIKYRKTSLSLEQELGDNLGIATSYNNIGSTYYHQGDFQEAITHFQKGLVMSKDIGAIDRMVDSYAGLADASAGMKQYKKAFEYHQAYSTMKDSLINEDNNQQIADMKEKYESEKKDAQIELLQKDKDLLMEAQKRKSLIRNMMLVGCLLLTLFAFTRYRYLQTLRIEKMRNKISKDLHDDIGSTLSSISINSSVAERMNPDQYPEIISTLGYIGISTRAAMENMSDIVWAINPANDTFKNMMDRLQLFAYKILSAKNIRLQLDIPESLHHAKLSMPQRKNVYLILREAIHNVAKYSEASLCVVSAEIVKKKINLRIKDDGVGFDEISKSLGGNGLLNMKQRADELNAAFQIHSEKLKGTSLTLQFEYS